MCVEIGFICCRKTLVAMTSVIYIIDQGVDG